MPVRRLCLLLLNLCLLLSLSAQALSAALHPCLGAVPVVQDASSATGAMDHSQHQAMVGADSASGFDPDVDHSSMDCCEGADDCPMDQCVLLPVTLSAAALPFAWLVGSVEFPHPIGAPAAASFPPYHPPYLA